MSLKELPLPSIASLRAIAALKSPHLAAVRPARIGLGFELGPASQRTLADVELALGGPGRLSLSYSLRWLLDIATGLSVLHRTLGFVHGEVQPEHLVLGEDGVGRLIPVVRAHWVRGEERSPERLYYLAPERLLGDHIDVRSDVFSLGVLLWEALSGQRLLEAYTVEDIIARLMGGGIPRAAPPEDEQWTLPLVEVAERALSVDPARRFGSVVELKSLIESASQRYLASPPGMAQLFHDPELRARSVARESLPPESQRATLPPDPAKARAPLPSDSDLDRAAERLSRKSVFPVDLEEELTTKPNAVPVPVAQPKPHVRTLLGVPPPAIAPRELAEPSRPSAPDSVTLPLAPQVASSAPPVVIPSAGPSVSEPPPAPLPFGKTRAQFGATEPTRPDPNVSLRVAERTVSPAPLVAEPSFELSRPRRRRGWVWLALGGAAVVALLAASPWLARQAPTTTSAAGPRVDAPALRQAPAAARPAPSGEPLVVGKPLIGIADTPPTPSTVSNQASRRSRDLRATPDNRREQTVTPVADTAPLPAPAAPAPVPEPTPEVVAEPPAAEPPPPPPPPPVTKPKPAPPSDADRYGI